MNILQRCWYWLHRRTLLRRLLLWQITLMLLMWSLAWAYSVSVWNAEEELVRLSNTQGALLSIAATMGDKPKQQQQLFQKLSQALQEDYAADRELALGFVVWSDQRMLFHSPSYPTTLRNTKLNQAQRLCTKEVCWFALTRQYPQSKFRVMLLVRSISPLGLLITQNTSSAFLLPLMFSAGFLWLPACLAIYLGLRPWRKVVDEIASRDPQDLTLLSFRPKYQELAVMVDSINTLLQRVQASKQREHSFIADAAHELRTPLAAMAVHVAALQLQLSNSQQQELLAGIKSSNQRATRLATQLLSLMRNAALAEAAPQAITLDNLLQERLALLSQLAHAKGVELELVTQAKIIVNGYRETLISLIDNLIENAVKYSPEQATVLVSLYTEASHAVLTVADEGQGIAEQWRERAFDRFFRDPNQTQTGSGLGLAIVQAAVKQHAGSIQLGAVPAPRQGLLVTVKLPLVTGE